nr:M56 family metallopeptidase [Saccharofermentans sp.]
MKTILVLTLSGSVLTLLLTVLRYTFLRKMPSTVYYYAWLLVLLRFALPLPGLVPASAEKANELPAAPVAYVRIDGQENNDHDTEIIKNEAAKTGSNESTETRIVLNETETKDLTVTETAPKASFSIDWESPMLWLSVWAIGAVISMAVTVISYLSFSFGLKRNLMEPDSFTKSVYAAIPGRKPALYFSDSARTPMMLGILKPKIVLPVREYNEEVLLNILRHELTHYRRFDMLYKWATAAVLSVHWFNPMAWFIRREINRACEMSCDEMLLRTMDKNEKQSYGNTLLLMAASTALPSAVVATTFATEKRNLKERLVQIMNYKKSGTRLLAAVLSVALLTG